ncbi:hypothetical protein CU097_011782, partial [Rhizopus azygosporus]
MDNPVAGYSQCLAAACFQVSACYNNMIVECFQSRLMLYLVRTIRASMKQSNTKHVQKLADYDYQCISVMVKQGGLR